jgi:hypothetical protein
VVNKVLVVAESKLSVQLLVTPVGRLELPLPDEELDEDELLELLEDEELEEPLPDDELEELDEPLPDDELLEDDVEEAVLYRPTLPGPALARIDV